MKRIEKTYTTITNEYNYDEFKESGLEIEDASYIKFSKVHR